MPERKIHFYRAVVGTDDSDAPLPFNPHLALNHINGLPFTPPGRYLMDGDDAVTCWVDGPNPRRRFRVSYVRRSGLPLVERAGNLTGLPIPADSGLAETIHIIVFPGNIVGADFNFCGPRMSRVADYLAVKGGGHCPHVTFEALLRGDVTEALRRLEDIRLFHLKIRSSYAETVARANQSLGKGAFYRYLERQSSPASCAPHRQTSETDPRLRLRRTPMRCPAADEASDLFAKLALAKIVAVG